MNDFVKESIIEEENFLKNIFNRFRKRDFSGTTGQAMKNSSYQLASSLVAKIGSLLFTIIIARMLMPERMGLYSLALATILLFSVFSDLGIGSAIITFISKALGKGDNSKAKGYTKKLFKWKYKLIILSSLILMIGAYFISEYWHKKPIFYAVLVGALYIPVTNLIGFIEQIFKASNNFKTPMIKDIIFQITRLTIIPILIFLLLKTNFSDKFLIVFVMLSLTACYLVALLFLGIKAKKQIPFLKVKATSLDKKESRDLKKFILPLTVTAFAGTFFGFIDTLMLGHYVASEFIAYYGAAFALIGSAGAIIGFATTALMPIFARMKGNSLENIFRKTRNFTLMLSILAAIFTYFTAWWIIRLAYGVEYLTAVPVLKWFSMLLIFTTLTGLYSGYFVSQKKTKVVSGLLIGSTILNIIFNVIGITYGLNHYGDIGGVYGAVGATILSRVVYLSGFIFYKKSQN